MPITTATSARARRTLALALTLSSMLAIGSLAGCGGSGGGGSAPAAMTERDFADDPSASAAATGVVVDFLEPATATPTSDDTGDAGTDIIPYEFSQTVTDRFCWQDDDPAAAHYAALVDAHGAEVLRVQANGDCVTRVVEAGAYTLHLVHDGQSGETLPVFVEAIDGASGTTAGQAEEPVSTFLRSRKCVRCKLDRADLADLNLAGVDFDRATFNFANLNGANLQGANLYRSEFVGATLVTANLKETDVTQSAPEDADLTGVSFVGAELYGTGFSRSVLSRADLSGLTLTTVNLCRARLDGTDFSGSDLSGANWRNCEPCRPGSIGQCVQERIR